MDRATRIAVVGAGLGGMTTAALLQRAGFTVGVYEQAAAFSRIGAGIHFSSNVMLVMRRLGIEKSLSDIGLHPDAFVSRKWDTGEILFELPFDPASEAHYGAAYINVHRGDLHAVMETALIPGLSSRTGRTRRQTLWLARMASIRRCANSSSDRASRNIQATLHTAPFFLLLC
jgi:6-hydroxynicotinate 3-monooxygenase